MSETSPDQPHGSLFARHISKRLKLFTSQRRPSRLKAALQAAAVGAVFASSVAAAGFEVPKLTGEEGRGMQMVVGQDVPADVQEAFWDGAQLSGFMWSKLLEKTPEYPRGDTDWFDGSLFLRDHYRPIGMPEYSHQEVGKFDLMVEYSEAVHFLAMPQEFRLEMAAVTRQILVLSVEHEIIRVAAAIRSEDPTHPLLEVLGDRSQMPEVSDPVWDAAVEYVPYLERGLPLVRMSAEEMAEILDGSKQEVVRAAEALGFSAPSNVPAGSSKLERNLRSLQEQMASMTFSLDEAPQKVEFRL